MPTPEQLQQRLQELKTRDETSRQQRQKALTDLVARLHSARVEAEQAATRLQTVADEMRVFSRRAPQEGDSAYVVYANAHLRFAGAVLQGAKRTSSMDRLLKNAQQEQEETRLRNADQIKQREARDTRRRFQKLEIPTDHDFEELYGEMVK